MRAMVINAPREPLRFEERAVPAPGKGEILIRVRACGVCRTDLHVVDGELPQTRYPVIPGHEIVGEVAELGEGVEGFAKGERLGVPWLGWTCGRCRYCLAGTENLCDFARFTGCSIDGGYADYTVADQRFCFRLPAKYDDAHAAPLLCAGLIGHRAPPHGGRRRADWHLRFRRGRPHHGAGCPTQGQHIYAFTPPATRQRSALRSRSAPNGPAARTSATPVELDAAIIFASVGGLIPAALGGGQEGRPGDCRRHPYVRHTELPVRHLVGRARRPLGRQFARAPTASISCVWPRRRRSRPP